MTINPSVSVIMTTYNSEKYLHAAIQSILNQTFSEFELLIVDDDSTDRTKEIITSLADSRIKLIMNSERKGVAYARNIALHHARGEYVAVLDSDDIAFPDRLRLQIDYLNSHRDVNLVGSAFEIIDCNGKLISIYQPITVPIAIKWELLFKDVIGHSTVMFRRSVALELGGYDQSFLVAEDFDLWIRFAAYGEIAQMEKPLVQWRFTEQSMQNRDLDMIEKFTIEVVLKSIRLQTNQHISRDAALYLTTSHSLNKNDKIAQEALEDLLNCYRHFNNIAYSEEGRRCIKSLTIRRLLMTILKNPKSKCALTFLILTARIRLFCIFSPLFLITVLSIIIPSWMLNRLKCISLVNYL